MSGEHASAETTTTAQRQADEFLRHLAHARRLSPNTLSGYRRDLTAASNWMASQGIDDFRQADETAIQALIAARHRSGLSGRSLQRQLSALRTLYRYLQDQGETRANPAESVRAPKSPRKLPATLDADEVARLLDIDDEEPLATRDRALLELFYSSGLRLAELASLRWEDLDQSGGTVRVTGKGSRTREVPVGAAAKRALDRWRAERAQWPGADCPEVFISRQGQGLSHRAIQSRVRHWAQRQGLWQRVHPHLLRHSFATHILESSSDLRAVQELLGHANISTTQVYTHLDFQHLARVYDKSHPRARKSKDPKNGD